MTALKADFYKLGAANRDGSHATQAARLDTLCLVSDTLKELGYGVKSANGLKPKHIQHLVKAWFDNDKTVGTIKNRVAHLRWCAVKTGKLGMIPRSNSELGIPDREASTDNKSQKLDLNKLQSMDCPKMRTSMRLMAAFGLRLEEAIMFNPTMADKGDFLALKPSWTKGRRYREIPILTERQRALVDEAKQLVGNASLIPDDKSRIQHRKALEYKSLKAGFTNLHGLRHNYAQARYKSLTGHACPKAGGKQPHLMGVAELKADQQARLQISNELGHGRIEITKSYLG